MKYTGTGINKKLDSRMTGRASGFISISNCRASPRATEDKLDGPKNTMANLQSNDEVLTCCPFDPWLLLNEDGTNLDCLLVISILKVKG